MTTDLHTANINDLTFPDVVAFCSEQRPESIRLEYKEKWSSNKPGRQIAKEICAFANTRGGLLILGVEEDDENRDRPTPNPQGQELGPNPRQQILHACSSHIYPPLAPDVSEFLKNPAKPESGFVVVRVHPSRDVPHTISDGRDIYVRVHDSSEPIKRATIDQIDRMLEQRRTLVSLQEARVDRAIESMRRALALDQQDLEVVVGPVMPSEALLDREGCKAVILKATEAAETSVRSTSEGAYVVDDDRSRGFFVDMFGNALVILNLRSLLHEYPASKKILRAYGFADLANMVHREQMRAVRASQVCEAILKALLLARTIEDDTGFSGGVRLRIEANDIRIIPLVHEGASSRGVEPRLVAHNRVEPRVSLSEECRVLDPPDVADSAAANLMWAWGGHQPGFWQNALEYAERRVYRTDRCQCGKEKPKLRVRCLTCRETARKAAATT